MHNLFNDITHVNKVWFKNTIKQNLNDSYTNKWSVSVFNSSACINYRAMTEYKQLQKYLLILIKCANHRMPMVRRHSGILVDDRKCELCDLNNHYN